jgi:hypothetical protein
MLVRTGKRESLRFSISALRVQLALPNCAVKFLDGIGAGIMGRKLFGSAKMAKMP